MKSEVNGKLEEDCRKAQGKGASKGNIEKKGIKKRKGNEKKEKERKRKGFEKRKC